MTVDEMANGIDNFCDGDCSECVLDTMCTSIMGAFRDHPTECTEAYRIITETESNVDHPHHYNQGGIECIDAMIAAFGEKAVENFCLINAFKYVWRSREKNGFEDIDKAIWYLNKAKELNSGE